MPHHFSIFRFAFIIIIIFTEAAAFISDISTLFARHEAIRHSFITPAADAAGFLADARAPFRFSPPLRFRFSPAIAITPAIIFQPASFR
jgi:hypothetical protein